MKTLENSFEFDASNPAKFRLHVLKHFYKYGWRSTVDAFGIGKSTLYDWKKSYERSRKSLTSLIPKKTRPKRVRQMTTDPRIVQFIREFREQYGNIGREKIKIFLDEYVLELGINSISERTISKVIKQRNLFFDPKKKTKRKNKFARYRTKKAPQATAPGFVEIDCVILYINSLRHNFICCIDIYTKFAHVRKTKSISSLQAKLTFQEFEKLSPHKIHTVQTDNGSEFFLNFHEYLEQQNINHQFIYPKSPKINGVVERFNRTIQEEFINRNDEIFYDFDACADKLNQYLTWYNSKRPHMALNYLSPLQFIQTNFPESTCP
jgi:putative transposase